MTVRTAPPSLLELDSVLTRLNATVGSAPRAAAAFLASPTWVPVTDCSQWRARTTLQAPASLTDLVELAQAAHRPGDEYLDVAGEPHDWFKLQHSGAWVHVRGPRLLFDAPHLHARADVTASQVRDFLAATDFGRSCAPGSLSTVATRDGTVLVQATRAGLRLHRA